MTVRCLTNSSRGLATVAAVSIEALAAAWPGASAYGIDRRPADPPAFLAAGGIAIRVPSSVDPGQSVAIAITGGPAVGRLEIWGPVRYGDVGTRIAEIAVQGGSLVISAPGASGSYTLRYLDSAGNVLARAELEVTGQPVRLSIPDPIGAGYEARIEWTGPAEAGDLIQIFDPANGQVVAEAPATPTPGTGPEAMNVAILRAPELVGDFQIRYWSGRGQSVLSAIPMTVGDGIGWLRAPTEVQAGAEFVVTWHGPLDPEHSYQIVDAAAGTILGARPAVTDGEPSVRFTAPEKPGDYRVRYVNTRTGFVLADLPLDVDPE